MPKDLYLYGGDRSWNGDDWVTSDDRVRGGSSISHLEAIEHGDAARFWGNLDTSTLGGAGFASQHSKGTKHWDLTAYDGLLVTIEGSTDSSETSQNQSRPKRFLVTLKDEIPGKRHDGREKSGLSWEADFSEDGAASSTRTSNDDATTMSAFLPWDAFKPTYRGRDKPDSPPLDKSDIKRIGVMMRSFFDEQSGAFSIVIKDIRATTSHSEQGLDSAHGMQTAKPGHRDWHSDEEEEDLQKQTAESVTATNKRHSTPGGSSWWRGVFCGLL